MFRNDCVAVTLHSKSPPFGRQQEPSRSLSSNTLLQHTALGRCFRPQHLVATSSHHLPAGNERTERKGRSAKSLRGLHVTRSPSPTGAHIESCHKDLGLSSTSPVPCHIHKMPHWGLTLGVQIYTFVFWSLRAFFSTFHSDERWIPPFMVPA